MRGETANMRPPQAAQSPASDRVLCGWRVRSAVPLPEAMPWSGDHRAPDVTIVFGAMPALLEPIQKSTPVQMGHDGACRLEFENSGRFHVVDGREVIVEPRGPFDTPEFRALLLGPVLGTLCHQRGLFPLHAACVRIGGDAVALMGRSGAGKSTLAAALACRGHPLVADDVCVIDLAAPDAPRVLPSFPRLKLWDDALQALDIGMENIPRSGAGKRKFHYYQPGRFDPSPVGLRGICLLDPAMPAAEQAILPVGGPDAAALLSKDIYRRWIGFHLGRKTALLAEALRIAAAVPIFRLAARPDLSQLDAIATRVEAHFAALTAS